MKKIEDMFATQYCAAYTKFWRCKQDKERAEVVKELT